MNILLLNMPMIFNAKENLEFPLGLAYIASCLKKNGYHPRIKDFEVEEYSAHILSNILREFSPELIGISCRTASYKSAKEVTKLVKKYDHNIFVVIGGHHVSAFPENSINETNCDAVVRGEGEQSMVELAHAITASQGLSSIRGLSFRKNDVVCHNQARQMTQDLDSLPFPSWDLLPMDKYVTNSVITSRGCPFSCTYCDKTISSRKVNYRSADNVFKEIQELTKLAGNKLVYFVDDFFFLNRKRVLNLFELLMKSKTNMKWCCQSRVNPLDLALLPKAKESGCQYIIFGIETGDEKELKFINKETKLKEVEDAVKAANSAGIKIRANFMLGFPISTKETIINSIKFASKLPIDICRFFIVSPLPNTELWDYVVKNNLIESSSIKWDEFNFYSPNYNIPGITREELKCYAGAAYLHMLKWPVLKEILLFGFPNLFKLIRLILATGRIRGNLSKTFSALSNLIVEIYFLIKNKSVLSKIKYIIKIIRLEMELLR